MFRTLFSILFLWTVVSGAECGFYVCHCNSADKVDYTMQLNVISQNGYPTEIKKKLYKYRDDQCGDTNYVYELLTVYNVSRLSEQNGKVIYSVFPRSQQFTLFDEDMCSTIDTRPALQVRVPYNIYSSFFDMAQNTSFILDLRENNYNKNMEMTFGSPMTFVELNSGKTYQCDRVADTGCASGSAGGDEDGDRTVIVRKSNWLLWVIILVLVCIIIFLIYYRRNYRYLPITERKRIDQPEDRAEAAEAEAKKSQDVESRAD